MLSDIKFALRQLVKSPGFTLTVIITLALGIGACTAMFTIVKTVLLSPLNGTPDPEHVVFVNESRRPAPLESSTSVPTFKDWKRQATSFQTLSAVRSGRATLIGGAEPLPLLSDAVSEGYDDVVQHPMALGRWFRPEEFTLGKNKVVILRYEFWQRAFGGDAGVLSRSLQINAAPVTGDLSDELVTVIGVAAPWPGGGGPRDVILPLVLPDDARADRGNRRNLTAIGRLKPGVTVAAAQSEMNLIAAQLAAQYPDTNKDWGVKLISVADLVRSLIGETLWMMMAAVACVLLIACANVANLQLVRATVRHREISIRAALGAGRLRLTRQLLSESLVMAFFGGAAGVLLADWALAAYQHVAPGSMLRGFEYRVDTTIVVFAAAISLGSGLLVGLLPAWIASRINLNDALKQATRGSTQGGRGAWLRSSMVTLQVAGAVVLLGGAVLFLRSFHQLANVDPGFIPKHAIAVRLFNLSAQKYRTVEQRNQFVEEVLARVRALPGVEAAGATLQLPINESRPGLFGFAIDVEQAAQPKASWPTAAYYTVSTDYFRAAGLRVLRGRSFSIDDRLNAPRVAVINDTMVRRYFADRDPIGQTIRIAGDYDGPRMIVGVVSDIKQDGLDQDSICQVYEPNAQMQATPWIGTHMVVRHTGSPASLIPLIKDAIHTVDKDQPITAIAPMEELVDNSIEKPRFRTELVAVFSALALIIAAVGIYSVMAYSVAQRTTEIGIRMALGANSHDVVRDVLKRGFKIICTGLCIGLISTVLLSRLIAVLLYNTSSHDPVALATIAFVLAWMALLACWTPARSATRVDPMIALRCE